MENCLLNLTNRIYIFDFICGPGTIVPTSLNSAGVVLPSEKRFLVEITSVPSLRCFTIHHTALFQIVHHLFKLIPLSLVILAGFSQWTWLKVKRIILNFIGNLCKTQTYLKWRHLHSYCFSVDPIYFRWENLSLAVMDRTYFCSNIFELWIFRMALRCKISGNRYVWLTWKICLATRICLPLP